MSTLIERDIDDIMKLKLISDINVLKEYLIKNEKVIFSYIGNLFLKNLDEFLKDLLIKKETLLKISDEIITKEEEIKNNLKEFDNSKNYIDKKNIQILKRLNKANNLFHRFFEEDNIIFLQKKRTSEEEILVELDNHLNKVRNRYDRTNKIENYETIIVENNFPDNNKEFIRNNSENIIIKSYCFRKKIYPKKFTYEKEINDSLIQNYLDCILRLISKDENEEYYINNFWDMINKNILYEESLNTIGKIEHFIYQDLKDKISLNFSNIKVIFITLNNINNLTDIKNKIFNLISLFHYYLIEIEENKIILKCCLRKKFRRLEENLIEIIKKSKILKSIELKAYSNKVDLFYKIPPNYKILGTNISKKFMFQIKKAKHSLNRLIYIINKNKKN